MRIVEQFYILEPNKILKDILKEKWIHGRQNLITLLSYWETSFLLLIDPKTKVSKEMEDLNNTVISLLLWTYIELRMSQLKILPFWF
jgi:hypothetical protein